MGARHSPAPQLINGAGLVAVHKRLPVGACVGSHNGSRRGRPRSPGQCPVGECAGIAAGGLEKDCDRPIDSWTSGSLTSVEGLDLR
jgi:hypothetical protein